MSGVTCEVTRENLGKVRCYPQNSSTELRSITREGREVRYLRKVKYWAKAQCNLQTQALAEHQCGLRKKRGWESPAYAQSEMLASLQNSTGNERCDLRSITREGQKVRYPRKVKCWAKARCNLQNSNTEFIRKTQAQSSEA